MGGRGGPVLVVDDYADIRELVTEILDSAGYAVIEASTGKQGLEMATADPSIRLLIVDVGLPDMVGTEVARAIRKVNPRCAVLVMTGSSGADVGTEFQVLEKPFFDSDLMARVESLLGSAPHS